MMRQPLVIALLAVAVAILSWALVYYAKDEWKLATETPDDNVPTRSAAKEVDGHAAVELSEDVQRASGIVTAPLQSAQSGATTEVFGTVVNLQPLIESRARFLSSLGEATAVRSTVQALRTEHERLRVLYADDRNVSERAVQAAETLLRTEQARLAAIEQGASNQREAMRLAWGATLTGWATNPRSKAFEGLLSGREVLVQLSLPPERGGKTKELALNLPGGISRPARLVSAAPAADTLLPGATYFYAAPEEELRVGMRVTARLRAGGQTRQGVIIPATAVVWHAGKAWVYTKGADEDDLFVRREISTGEEMADGFFNATDWDENEQVVVSGAQLLLSEELKFQIRNENED